MSTENTPKARSRPKTLAGIVSLGLMLGLAGVVGPDVAEELTGEPHEIALRDMQAIVSGLRSYSQDTLLLPTGIDGRTDVGWLYGPGELPQANPFVASGASRPLEDALQRDVMGGERWAGPYLGELPIDPWGRAYLVSVSGLVDGRTPPMVLSAGPDGFCDTPVSGRKALGDDVLLPLN